jgi:transcriptional regulator with XRE-family HTH domain
LYNKYNGAKGGLDWSREMSAFGDHIKKLRIAKGATLRDHCLEHGIDPGNYSRLERGLFPPPQKEELLAKYAKALGIKPKTDEWLEFFDLAAASRGELPKDLQDDDEIIGRLPVLFRTLRGDRIPLDKLDELVAMLRRHVDGDRK